jgi:hypothetical protein
LVVLIFTGAPIIDPFGSKLMPLAIAVLPALEKAGQGGDRCRPSHAIKKTCI